MRKGVSLLVVLGLLVSVAPAGQKTTLAGLATKQLSEDQAILHALNRLGFGPRPGDLERVRKLGLEKYIEQQLHPTAPDDPAMAARLSRFPTLAMSSWQLLEEFPQPNQAARRLGITPEEYRKQMEERLRQQQAPGMGPARPEDLQLPQRITAELGMAKLTRAIFSERQLQEMMVDFWFNHFNVFAGKGVDRWLLTSYERDAIRPHALGRFRDLLQATAEHPAMLFYLDNWMSVDPKAGERMEEVARRFQRPEMQALRQRRGLNENYARELMELHTLGVDGGYTQKDVQEVARCFTGWTMRAPRVRPEFYFEPRMHDSEPKMVLGKKIQAGGKRDGEQVLDLLSRHPKTARFLSTKLARRFVADEPPAKLVERMAKSFQETDGDIGAVLRTMIYSPEFWSRQAYRAKIKKPFELVASAARAVGAELDPNAPPMPLLQWTQRIGEPLYGCQPPTGYSDKAEAWVNTGALLNRMNFGLALAGGRMRAVRVDPAAAPGSLDDAIRQFLGGEISAETRSGIEKQMTSNSPALIAGLVLGSPEFQRR